MLPSDCTGGKTSTYAVWRTNHGQPLILIKWVTQNVSHILADVLITLHRSIQLAMSVYRSQHQQLTWTQLPWNTAKPCCWLCDEFTGCDPSFSTTCPLEQNRQRRWDIWTYSIWTPVQSSGNISKRSALAGAKKNKHVHCIVPGTFLYILPQCRKGNKVPHLYVKCIHIDRRILHMWVACCYIILLGRK